MSTGEPRVVAIKAFAEYLKGQPFGNVLLTLILLGLYFGAPKLIDRLADHYAQNAKELAIVAAKFTEDQERDHESQLQLLQLIREMRAEVRGLPAPAPLPRRAANLAGRE
jgi:hypothetical protein